MPAKFIFIILFSVATSAGFSQKQPGDSTKTKDSTVLSNLSNKVDEILERLKATNITDKEFTGIISYDTLKQVRIYTSNWKPTRHSVRLDKVMILFQDGYIVDIQIFAKDKIFTNARGLISINGKRFSSSNWDLLFNKMDIEEHINLQEALTYVPLTSFFPEDRMVILTNQKPFDTLYKNVGINSVIDLRLYTDALAALGSESNGIFQTDIRLKQFLHRLHYRNRGMRIFQYFKINFTASKIDSKNAFVDGNGQISRSDLMQKAKLNTELLVNIYTSWLGRKTINTYFFDVGGGFSNVNLARQGDTTSISVPMIFFEGGINLRNSSNIGFEFLTRYIFQYSPQTDFEGQNREVKFIRLSSEVFWNPFKDPASRVFGRINYTMGLKQSEKKNSYSQIQIGYSTLISKAIGKK